MLYHNGFGVDRDTAEAARRWRTAVGLGDPEAAFFVGTIVEGRSGAAIPWLRQAADAGHGQAAYSLYFRYRDGVGVEADSAEAVAWLERAAEVGDEWAVRNLRGLVAFRAGR